MPPPARNHSGCSSPPRGSAIQRASGAAAAASAPSSAMLTRMRLRERCDGFTPRPIARIGPCQLSDTVPRTARGGSTIRLQAHLLFALVVALVSASIVRVMIRWGTLDQPGARSSHTQPTPKGGGVGIACAFVFGMMVLFAAAGRARVPDAPFLGLIGAACLIAAVSYADDVRSWSAITKLLAQSAAALAAIGCGIRFGVLHLPWFGAWDSGWLGIPLTAGWILFATNAVNFIDGLNGLASGSVALACLILAGIGWAERDWFVHVSSLVLAAGILGFLPFNYPRARIFMGDVGSQFCGFVLAVIGVLAAGFGAQTLSVLLVPMLLAGILFDVAFTLARRLVAGDRLMQAHRSHLYQLAHRAGRPAWAITLVHWGMVAWGGVCCLAFQVASGSWKTALPAAVLLPQLLWLALVLSVGSTGEDRRLVGRTPAMAGVRVNLAVGAAAAAFLGGARLARRACRLVHDRAQVPQESGTLQRALNQNATAVHRIDLAACEVELPQTVERACDRGLGHVQVGCKAAYRMRALLKVARQEHAQLPGGQVGAVPAHQGHDRITEYADHLVGLLNCSHFHFPFIPGPIVGPLDHLGNSSNRLGSRPF